MKKFSIAFTLLMMTTPMITPAAWADNVAHCEVLTMEVVTDEAGSGEAQIGTYSPAVTFLTSLYDDDTDSHITSINNQPIQAVLCRRNNIIPAPTDYNILATGIPFILSQDLDSPDTDILTVYWKDGAFNYDYKGHPLSDEGQSALDIRLADFTQRGLKRYKTETDEEE